MSAAKKQGHSGPNALSQVRERDHFRVGHVKVHTRRACSGAQVRFLEFPEPCHMVATGPRESDPDSGD